MSFVSKSYIDFWRCSKRADLYSPVFYFQGIAKWYDGYMIIQKDCIGKLIYFQVWWQERVSAFLCCFSNGSI